MRAIFALIKGTQVREEPLWVLPSGAPLVPAHGDTIAFNGDGYIVTNVMWNYTAEQVIVTAVYLAALKVLVVAQDG